MRRKTELSQKTTVTRESPPVRIKSPTLTVHPMSATGFQFAPSHSSTVVPEKSEISHEFEMAPADILYNSYDIIEKNKLKHFAKAKAMHDFIKANVNVKRANPKTKIGGNIIIIDDDFICWRKTINHQLQTVQQFSCITTRIS